MVKQKHWSIESYTITRLHKKVHVNCSTCTHFFLKETDQWPKDPTTVPFKELSGTPFSKRPFSFYWRPFMLLTITFYYDCAVYYHLCQWEIQSLYNLEFYFLWFRQGYIKQKQVHQFLTYKERDFLYYLNGESNLGLCGWIPC